MRCAVLPLCAICFVLSGCSDGTFGDGEAQQILTEGTKALDGEQVVLTGEQLACGEREDLWRIELQQTDRSLGRLTEKARALGFDDDVRIGEQPQPYTQLRGQFSIQVLRIESIRDESAKVKIVDAKVAVTINHSCFNRPLPLMGVKKGKFTQDVAPRFQLALNGQWEYDRLLH